MGKSNEEPDILIGQSVKDARPGKLSELPEDRRSQVVWEIRFWRMRQFMWGWCWGVVFDIGYRLVYGEGTYVLCMAMAFMAGLAHWYGRGLNAPVLVIQK